MDILKRFKDILNEYQWQDRRVIVAVSGGLDSMLLAWLFHEAAVQFQVAHCNFGLRGVESDEDEAFVRSWAVARGIPFHVASFNTRDILEKEGGNLQETARVLRYDWLEGLRVQLNYDFIATAHHMQDGVETMLINLFRGTGISGLHGILPQYGNIIRPLLSFSKEEMKVFATKVEITWREDSSNAKDDYTRNQVRHRLLPIAEEIFPNVLYNLYGNLNRFREVEQLYNESIERYRHRLVEQRGEDRYIPVLKLKYCQPLGTLFWELVKPYNFKPAQLHDLLHLLNAETGRYVQSGTHRIIRNRNFLIITSLKAEESHFMLLSGQEEKWTIPGGTLQVTPVHSHEEIVKQKKFLSTEPREVYLDAASLSYPLILRPWKTGDYFYPLGMSKKKKKLSRFFIDQKMALHEKEKIWVVESNKKIVWIVGMRLDERFKVTEHTRQLLHMAVERN